MNRRHTFIVVAAGLLLASGLFLASILRGEEQPVPHSAQLGGDTTRPDATRNGFGLPAPNITGEQRRTFELGDSFFTQNWVTAPASTVARDGLGPVFNAQACASCHVLDGRGAPPLNGNDTATRGLLVRVSVPGTTSTGSPKPDPVYGDQIQDRGIGGIAPEASVRISYDGVAGTYGDGAPYSLRKPTVQVTDLAYGPLSPDAMFSARLAPQMIGMGLLEAIPEQSILARADVDDKDNDGISGRPNYVWNERTDKRELGRFGWKANQPSVSGQVSGAFHGDIGITSSLAPGSPCRDAQTDCGRAPSGGEPEIDDERLGPVVFYSRVLAVPQMRAHEDKTVAKGANAFTSFGCASCHTVKQTSGPAEVSAVANQTFHPFTDLLLHDMGPGLADGRPDFDATGTEWRTPPLWGLGLVKDVNGHLFLLHDGRARTFEEAILWHGGEGERSKEAFRTASEKQRIALIKYLESL